MVNPNIQKLKQKVHDSLIDIAPYVAKKVIDCSLVTDNNFSLADPQCCVAGHVWLGETYRKNKITGEDEDMFVDFNPPKVNKALTCKTCTKYSVDLYQANQDHLDEVTIEFLKLAIKFSKHVHKTHPELVKDKNTINKFIKKFKNRKHKLEEINPDDF